MPRTKDPKTVADLINVRLQLTPDDHAWLRIVAAQNGKPMAIFAREVVLAAIGKPEKKSR